ncbi:MAG: peptidase M23 [Candidatus Woesebacteria bacterium GW2011_GWB1_38_5b]|uniref:Peptidase M23 n=1 Tax=Candidatus Woesebacteria bacterium GW2011_GWB1_38_5b TaxID=1618569 RepID=A0A0G0NDF5_9BACT|nr:MAG: peptidase M23 [Candidatus Woesebacteria bacterium GW2011_GWB1_38_5b]OGH47241.1 MAG: hypothetical protein A3A51_01795 [Candidatus Levybacteria bacterium RIFCSPLOWO2_01_FULL_39_10]
MLSLRKNKIKIFVLLFILLFAVTTNIGLIQAQTQTPTPTPTSSKNYEEILKKIEDTEKKIEELESEKKTLSSQIAVIDNQIQLTELKIDSTEVQISDLTLDIDTADKKIDEIEASLDKLTQVLVNRIKATYMIGSASPFHLLLSSSDVSDFITRANYLRIAQAHDKRLIFDTTQAKNDYENQREIFEDKKLQIEKLKRELVTYTSQLDQDKGGKEQLLAVTENDEKKYQEELARFRADAASINAAIGNVGDFLGTVNKGDVIASVGSSGCSTGPHLHFEVYTDAKVESGRVIGNRVDPKPYLENSSYQQPVPGYSGSVTTWYGEVYFLGTHTGIDIANPYGTPIRAMDGGDVYFTSAPCSYNISGGSSLGKGVIVDHKNGLVTLYWHIP